ncbi:MAG: gamma-glutamyl-gamma-aminobutyrate hydrolase family protein [Pseudomonadales bacterium]
MAAHARPLIAITGPRRGAALPRLCIAACVAIGGGRSVQLSPSRPDSPEPIDGVVVSGGHDVSPVLYAQDADVLPQHDPERDAFELAVIDAALERDLPVLGICRGAQLLNVHQGGTLHGDLRQLRRRTSHRRTILPLKTLLVAPGSRLASIFGCGRARINSLHNQSIDALGTDLEVAARDLDGIVQAVEGRRRFLLGVQWHPEFLLYLGRHRALFRQLIRMARRDGRRHRRAWKLR